MHRRTLRWLATLQAASALLLACAPSAPPPPAPAAGAPAPAAPAPAVAAAAAQASVPTAAAVAAPVRVRMGTQTSVNDIAMWLGAERGYFQEEGIDLDLVPFSNASELVPSLATDQMEAGGIAFNPATINAIARGVPIKVVLDRATFRPGFATQAMVVRKPLYDTGRGRT